jgi:hypothetical protein
LRERDGVELLQRVEQHLALMRGEGLGGLGRDGFQAVEPQVGAAERLARRMLGKRRRSFR